MLREVAKGTGRAPSDVVGIDCKFCAYCFDEALLAALWDEQAEEIKQREAEDRMTRLKKSVGLN